MSAMDWVNDLATQTAAMVGDAAKDTSPPVRHTQGTVIMAIGQTEALVRVEGQTGGTVASFCQDVPAHTLVYGQVVELRITNNLVQIEGVYGNPPSGTVVQTQTWFQQVTATFSTSSTAFATATSAPQPSFTKLYDTTQLVIATSVSSWMAGAAGGTEMGWSDNVTGNLIVPLLVYWNTTTQHQNWQWSALDTSLQAGPHVLTFQVHVASATQTWHMDSNDYLSVTVTEVWP